MLKAPFELFHKLDEFTERIPLAELRRWLETCKLEYDDVQSYLQFHVQHYVRNLMYNGTSYQALVLCWRNGQRSPIHDHLGSNCAVKILHGHATETLFRLAPNGMIYPTGSCELSEGMITASHDDDIHQVSNLQADNVDLVTLHLYSPPLLYMNTYSLLDGSVTRFFDPINDSFVAGAGI